jgi:RNA polymerase sigma factor (sigma-70 family)
MVEMARMVRLVAPRSTAVLIEGETGTGKELVAKAIHRLSARASKPFVVLNCAAIPESLLEAELFGHTRGAFTGAVQSRMGRIEAANGGTLFLDEIGEMPLALQAKMLRFLESGELQRVGDNETMRVDVRVIAATHQHLREAGGGGTFRLDLYHRLAVFPVFLPALKDRMEDVPLLAAYLLEKMGEEMPVKRLSAGAAARLMEYDWPGNVRELAHVLERARDQLLLEHLPTVRYLARRIHERLPQHVELDDLISAGVVGLIDAFSKFDHTKQVQFKSYAQFRIRGAILDSLRTLDWSPRELRRKGRAVEEAIRSVTHKLGRVPAEPEIAKEMELELGEYQQLLGELKGLEIGSLHMERTEDSGDEELPIFPGRRTRTRCSAACRAR